MKNNVTTLIQTLYKPDGKDKLLSEFGPVYNGFQINTIKDLKNLFILGHMGACEYECGGVAGSFYYLLRSALAPRSIFRSPVISGKLDDVYYICFKAQELYVQKIIQGLQRVPNSFELKRYCGFTESRKAMAEGKNPELVGWLEINNGFMFFLDLVMFRKVKQYFEII